MEGGIGGKDHAVTKVTEAFAIHTFLGITPDDWRKLSHGVVDRDTGCKKSIEPCAIVFGPEVERILAGGLPNKADLSKIGPGTSVRASRDPQANRIAEETVFLQNSFKLAKD